MKTPLMTILAMLAFAANSVLCRMALGGGLIDAASFTAVRLATGVLVLFVILTAGRKQGGASRGSWLGAAMLFLYAVTFSYAYLSLDAGSGALILFGAVQITMILLSMLGGYRPGLMEWSGLTVAFAGFVWLVLPGVSAPAPAGFVLMCAAGVAWGVYSLKGRHSRNPLMDTAWNFTRTMPLVIVLALVTFRGMAVTPQGAVLAMLSGGIASGIGYAVWYVALRGLTATQAAVVQLSVPVIAAAGGVVFIGEALSSRLALAALGVLCGILLVIFGRKRRLAG